ncbi:38507_t:CDS:2, partial [Gigaspora margarita]
WSKAVSIIGTNKYKNIGARKNSLRESLSNKTDASSSTQRITEVRKQTYSSFSRKENISQTDLLQEILKRLNCLEIFQKE